MGDTITYKMDLSDVKLKTFQVTFADAGDTKTQSVLDAHTAEKPANPTKTGYTFGGWYADQEYKTEFKFDTAILDTTTVYAKWTEKTEIKLDETAQKNFVYDGTPKAFEIKATGESAIPTTGFTITYSLSTNAAGSASPEAKDAGTYNVTITRKEDETYKAYSETIPNGLVIDKANQSAPTGLLGVAPTTKGGADGKITGTTETRCSTALPRTLIAMPQSLHAKLARRLI